MLKETYLFLRKLENRIQILENRSSPFFDPESRELMALARRMGYRKKGTLSASERLYADYRAMTERIRGLFSRLIGEID